MAVIETWLRQDLKGLVSVRSLQGQVFSLDNGGNLIGVKVTKDGQPVTLTGTVTGYCILSDGQTVTVTGSGKSGIQNGNEAYIVLPQLVYSVPGQISIVIKLTSGSVTTTLAACTGYVYRSRTSNEVVPPGTPIPDLATLEEVIRRATAATDAANAATVGAEKVDASMTKEGDVITIAVTDRDGNVTEKTVTDQTEAMKRKADIDGYYEELAAGTADQLVSTEAVTDTTPYLYRKSGGNVDIGNRETLEKIVGGTVAWNQLANNSHAPSSRASLTIAGFADGFTITGTASENVTATGWFGFANPSPMAQNHVCMSVFELVRGTVSNLSSVQISLSGTSEGTHDLNSLKVFRTTASPINSWLGIANGTVFTDAKLRVQLFDLTAMFGPTIADYVYSLEQANAGDGVTWFRKLFPKNYYPYNPGELISVKPSSHDMVGFNLWDEEWELGGLAWLTGEPLSANDRIRGKYFCKCLPNTEYYIKTPSNQTSIFWYDANEKFVSYVTQNNAIVTSPSNAYNFKILVHGSTTYDHDICLNLSHSGSRNGEYEPYEKHSYPLADVELRGIVGIDENGGLVYDGDEYLPDGTVTRKYGIVDLGTLTWTSYSFSGTNIFIAALNNKKLGSGTIFVKGICSKYEIIGNNIPQRTIPDQHLMLGSTDPTIYVNDTKYANTTDYKAAMDGVYLLYELATPTTEQVAPYTPVQVVDDWGTEEFVDNREVAIPVGHSTSYMANLRDKLQHLPSLADEDGEYIVKQTGSQMSLAPFKAGTYPDMHVGVADQLLSKQSVEDQVPYGLRQSGDGLAIGDREENMIIGGTVAWNQMINKNSVPSTRTINGVTFTNNGDGTVTANGTAADTVSFVIDGTGTLNTSHVYGVFGCPSGGGIETYRITDGYQIKDIGNGRIVKLQLLRYYIVISPGATVSNLTFKPQLFDLTAMFGPTIADYVYNLEQANAGAGVTWFRKLFPKDYYEYNAGELKSVEAINAHEMVGFNQYPDYDFANGSINTANGNIESHSSRVTTNAFMTIDPSMQYYCHASTETYLFFYDKDKNYIGFNGNSKANKTFIPQNLANDVSGSTRNFSEAKYMRARYDISSYDSDFCISLSSSRNGEYEPYRKSSYPLDSSLTLRGIPKLNANNKLYYDGDTYAGDGTVTRRYGIVDLGALTWAYTDNVGDGEPGFYTGNPGIPVNRYNSDIAPLMCDRYTTVAFYTSAGGYFDGATSVISFAYQAGQRLYVRDSTYSDVAAFKTAMSGVMLVYELATPTTETAEPYQSVQQVDPYGTEEYMHSGDADVYVPVGHVTKYPSDLRSKIENAPDSPSGNGDYIVRKTADGVSYVPLTQAKEIPAPPSANGTYRLTVTVANGTPTYSWVSA